MAISVDISEAEIRNAIAVAIAESFSPERRDGLLRDIVRAHLQYKVNSYDKETMLGKVVGETVRAMALEALRAKLETLRPEIGAVVERALGPSFRDSVMQQLESALAHKIVSGIALQVDLAREDEA